MDNSVQTSGEDVCRDQGAQHSTWRSWLSGGQCVLAPRMRGQEIVEDVGFWGVFNTSTALMGD